MELNSFSMAEGEDGTRTVRITTAVGDQATVSIGANSPLDDVDIYAEGGDIDIGINTETVSYTHLDVYKRQALMSTSQDPPGMHASRNSTTQPRFHPAGASPWRGTSKRFIETNSMGV